MRFNARPELIGEAGPSNSNQISKSHSKASDQLEEDLDLDLEDPMASYLSKQRKGKSSSSSKDQEKEEKKRRKQERARIREERKLKKEGKRRRASHDSSDDEDDGGVNRFEEMKKRRLEEEKRNGGDRDSRDRDYSREKVSAHDRDQRDDYRRYADDERSRNRSYESRDSRDRHRERERERSPRRERRGKKVSSRHLPRRKKTRAAVLEPLLSLSSGAKRETRDTSAILELLLSVSNGPQVRWGGGSCTSASIESLKRRLLLEEPRVSPSLLPPFSRISLLSSSFFWSELLIAHSRNSPPYFTTSNASIFVAMNFQLVLVSIALATSALAAPSSPTQGQVFQAPIIPSVWKSIGKAIDTDRMTYTMSLKGQDMDGLTEKMYQIAESQGEWLTKDELRQYASVSDEGRTAVINYLKSQGVQDSDYAFSALGDEVEIRSSVARTSQMLSDNFETFIYSYSGESKALRTKEYTVDASIAQYVQNIYPIANFHEIKAPNTHKQKVDDHEIQHAADVQDSAVPKECDEIKVTPDCLRKLYGTFEYLPSKGDPENVDVAILEYLNSSTSQKDLTQFLKEYRPDAAGYKIPIVNVGEGSNDPSNPGFEAMLDVEIVVAATFPLHSTVYNFGGQDGFLRGFPTFHQG
ncbi:hypothetical protein L7F22_012291 [Adiantum nelumboides]|nr:hypothetical protein [Adiantum nelumboides]